MNWEGFPLGRVARSFLANVSSPYVCTGHVSLFSFCGILGLLQTLSISLPVRAFKAGIGGGYDSQGLRLRHSNSSGAPFEASSLPAYSGSTSSYYPDDGLVSQSHNPLTPAEIQRMELESGQQRQFQLIPDQDYLRQRADAMTQVESNIVELGTIFNKLAVMVNEHRDMVQRVEDNVDDANTNLNLSMATLTDTLQNLQTNRALAAKVLGIVVLFIIMFIIFFA